MSAAPRIRGRRRPLSNWLNEGELRESERCALLDLSMGLMARVGDTYRRQTNLYQHEPAAIDRLIALKLAEEIAAGVVKVTYRGLRRANAIRTRREAVEHWHSIRTADGWAGKMGTIACKTI